jgi:hypothetical protein
MRQVHCDGCGFKEPEGLPKSQQKIIPVSIRLEKDPRWPEGTDKNEADLCPSCIGLLLHTYFKVPMSDRLELEVPTFLGVDELEPIASRRAE